MLFITVKSAGAEQVPKVLQVVEEAKRLRYKNGDGELHQYVLYDTEKPKGPRRINLDDDNNKGKVNYKPPNSLTVHLSKIDMPELQPKPYSSEKSSGGKKADKNAKGDNASSSLKRPKSTDLLKKRKSSSPIGASASLRRSSDTTPPNNRHSVYLQSNIQNQLGQGTNSTAGSSQKLPTSGVSSLFDRFRR